MDSAVIVSAGKKLRRGCMEIKSEEACIKITIGYFFNLDSGRIIHITKAARKIN